MFYREKNERSLSINSRFGDELLVVVNDLIGTVGVEVGGMLVVVATR